ncbi:MAG: type IV pili methyl-accepting chemotaxis transducer N-terminal domain-containing protein [Anaerolineales bacterium]
MKIASIQGRMGVLFTAFFLLVAVSVGATFWGIDTQKKDAVVINLAGRQRMLVQQMTRLALEIEKGGDPSYVASLEEAAAIFEQTLNALRNGGEAPYLPDNTVEVPAQSTSQHLRQPSKTLKSSPQIWRDMPIRQCACLKTPRPKRSPACAGSRLAFSQVPWFCSGLAA